MYLRAHSWYSLRYGVLSIDRLLDMACDHGLEAMVLTDINTTMGIPEFVKKAVARGIRPIAGCEFRRDGRLLYTALARNREGLREINELITARNCCATPFPDEAPAFAHVYVVYPGSRKLSRPLRENERWGVAPSEARRWLFPGHGAATSTAVLYAPISFTCAREAELHRILRAIKYNVLISKLEPGWSDAESGLFLPPGQLEALFCSHNPLWENTRALLGDCNISFSFSESKNKRHFTDSPASDAQLLRSLALEGFRRRYGAHNRQAALRVSHELEVINRLGFSAYFLITANMVAYSMRHGIGHVGRGSGANSIVAYCLQITDVDPIQLDLYFERFLNPLRSSPPDFDIDYSWRDRDRVRSYLFSKYGEAHTALLGATSTFRGRSMYRELGKVFGLPPDEIDLLARNYRLSGHSDALSQQLAGFAGDMAGFPNLRTIHAGGVLISEEPLSYYTALDLPVKGFRTTQWDMYTAEELGFEKFDVLSQRGIGTIVDTGKLILQNYGIAPDMHNVAPFFRDEAVRENLQNGRTVGCFYIESPAMRNLLRKLQCNNYLVLVAASSIIRPGVARSGMMKAYIDRSHRPERSVYLHPVMKELLAETYGVMVYQEDVLKVAHHFAGLDLAEADLLRRAMSGKFRSAGEFARIEERFFSNCRDRGYPEALSREVWRQIASFAGYSFSKAHSASYAVESYQCLYLKSHFPLEFMVSAINNGGGFYPAWLYFHEAVRCGALLRLPCINRSHRENTLQAATPEVGQTATPEASLPVTCEVGQAASGEVEHEFLSGVEQGRGCKSVSGLKTMLYMGFSHLQGLQEATVEALLAERNRNGSFGSVADLMQRVTLPKEQLVILIRVGALRAFDGSKARLLWEMHYLSGHTKKSKTPAIVPAIVPAAASVVGEGLFPVASRMPSLPPFEGSSLADAWDETELLGFPVTLSPFDMLQTSFRGELGACEMIQNQGRRVRMMGRLVTAKYLRTVRDETMAMGTFLDVHGEFFDTVHFPRSLQEWPFRGEGIFLLAGKITAEYGVAVLEVEKMARLPLREKGV